MWKTILITLLFCINFTHSSTFPDTIPGAISDSITKSISTIKNVKENDLSHFLSFINSVLATIDITTHLISPTQSMNTSQLVLHYSGFKTEEHTVISDGYILNMVRIPRDGPAVILMHGIFASSNDWLGLGNNSLPLMLARNGYDVWMLNARGNTYSRENTEIPTTDSRFWDFSFDEMGRLDLAVCIDYICDTVGEEKKILYVGHSQGTTVANILLSERPEYNEKLLGVISMAPISFISNAKSFVFQLLVKSLETLETAFKATDSYEVFPDRPPTSIAKAIFASTKLLNTICFTMFFPLFGYDYDQIDYKHAREQLTHYLAGSALKQILHFLQIGARKLFQAYDYGKKGNMKKYGTRSPPKYKLRNISTNMSLYYCANDWLSDIKDVNKLSEELSITPDVYKVDRDDCNHVFFTYGKDAPIFYEELVLKNLNKLCS